MYISLLNKGSQLVPSQFPLVPLSPWTKGAGHTSTGANIFFSIIVIVIILIVINIKYSAFGVSDYLNDLDIIMIVTTRFERTQPCLPKVES